MTELSIVVTMYYSEKYVKEFYERSHKTLKKIGIDEYEFVLVDDGSPDNSLEEALKIHQRDPKVKVVELSRNFGHHKAMMTGLAHASGKKTFLIDIDLEEKPELLKTFWNELDIDSGEIVSAYYNLDKYSDMKTKTFDWYDVGTVDNYIKAKNLFKRVNDVKNSEKYFNKTLELDPKHLPAYNNLLELI